MEFGANVVVGTSLVAPLTMLAGCAERMPEAEATARLREMIAARTLPEIPRGAIERGLSLIRAPEGSLSGAANDTLYRVTIGELNVPSGRICACDPLEAGQAPHFVRESPTGRFPVELTIWRNAKSHDERVALAAIIFGHADIARWEPAVTTRTQLRNVLDGASYAVDCATGCFYDHSASDAIARFMSDDACTDRMWEAMGQNYKDTREWALVDIEPGRNIALFKSGFGDGGYLSAWAIDAQGQPVALVTDFNVLSAAPAWRGTT